MSYAGYLIKFGNYTIPMHSIAYESYKATWNSQDVDSYRDANGVLHRNAVKHRVPKIEITTRGNVKNKELASIMSGIASNYINATERKGLATFYIPELDEYKTAEVYVVDPEIEIKVIDADTNTITYKPIRLAFIGY